MKTSKPYIQGFVSLLLMLLQVLQLQLQLVFGLLQVSQLLLPSAQGTLQFLGLQNLGVVLSLELGQLRLLLHQQSLVLLCSLEEKGIKKCLFIIQMEIHMQE